MLAENALTTLNRMKLMLGLSDIEDEKTDMIVEMLVNRASSWIERQIGRHLGKRTYLQWYDADGQQELVTEEYPIISVEYVKQRGALVDPQSLSSCVAWTSGAAVLFVTVVLIRRRARLRAG